MNGAVVSNVKHPEDDHRAGDAYIALLLLLLLWSAWQIVWQHKCPVYDRHARWSCVPHRDWLSQHGRLSCVSFWTICHHHMSWSTQDKTAATWSLELRQFLDNLPALHVMLSDIQLITAQKLHILSLAMQMHSLYCHPSDSKSTPVGRKQRKVLLSPFEAFQTMEKWKWPFHSWTDLRGSIRQRVK